MRQPVLTSASKHPCGFLAVDQTLQSTDNLLFASQDIDEVRSMVGRVMKPHELAIKTRSQRLDARMHHATLGKVSLSRLRYGASVEINPGPLEEFYLVQMPLTGFADIQSDGAAVQSNPNVASVLSPQCSTHMQWSTENDQLMLRIDRSLLDRTLIGYLGHPLDKELRFDLGFEWRNNTQWLSLLGYLADCASLYSDATQNTLVISQIEQLVASVLLSSHHHNYTEADTARRTAVLPRHVRCAQDYLQAHAHEPISAEQLAEITGVSLRSLYSGFQSFLGVSPMSYLRNLRLEKVHNELLSGEARNVAGVALRWGFSHMGRFSSEYKRRYGETPSQTLKRL